MSSGKSCVCTDVAAHEFPPTPFELAVPKPVELDVTGPLPPPPEFEPVVEPVASVPLDGEPPALASSVPALQPNAASVRNAGRQSDFKWCMRFSG